MMKEILILLFLLSYYSICAQDYSIERLIKEVEAKNRTELNKDDSIFIFQTLASIDKECFKIDSILISHNFSNILICELVNRILEANYTACYSTILNHINYFEEHPHSIRPHDIENFPVSKAINLNPVYKNTIAQYMMESDYLDNCYILEKFPHEKIGFQGFERIRSYKWLLEPFKSEIANFKSNSCKKSNLLKIIQSTN